MVGYGRYGETETFPLDLPPGARVLGVSSELVEIEVPSGTTAFTCTDSDGAVTLAGMSILYAGTGVKIGVDDAPRWSLSGMRFHAVDVAIDVGDRDRAPSELDLFLRDCRFEDALTAVRGHDVPALKFVAERCTFRACEVGWSWHDRGRHEEAAAVRFDDCRFQDCERVALHVDWRARPAAKLLLSSCDLHRGEAGVRFAPGAGDAQIHLDGCRIEGFSIVGVEVAGSVTTAGAASRIEDCLFLSCGTAVRMLEVGRPIEVLRTEIGHGTQDGISILHSRLRGGQVTLASVLVHACADRALSVQVGGGSLALGAEFCTFAQSARAVGLRRKGQGRADVTLRACVLHARDEITPGVVAEQLEHCSVFADPGVEPFRDPTRGDWGLAQPTPVECAPSSLAARDLRGRSRDAEAPTPGAVEAER